MDILLLNVPTFLEEGWGGWGLGVGGGKLFHKIALITCKGVYLFSEPNQIHIALIRLGGPTLETETFAESCSRKKLF